MDFALVDRTTFKPVFVIELQDRTHDRRDRQESDALKRLALGQAGIPLLEIHPHHSDEKRPELLNQHLPWAS